MKIEVGHTYESTVGEHWEIVYKLDLEDVSHPYIGVEPLGKCARFDETGVNRDGNIQLFDKIEEPKLKPFTLETFPVEAWLRKKNATEFYRAVGIGDYWVGILGTVGSVCYTWSDLLEDFEYSVDGCKTWHPCGVKG